MNISGMSDNTKTTNNTNETKATAGLKICRVCQKQLQERDRFCRQCGTPWSGVTVPIETEVIKVFSPEDPTQFASFPSSLASATSTGRTAAGYATAPLDSAPCNYRPLSGSLAHAVVTGVENELGQQLNGRVMRKLLTAVLSIPVWLIIVLLSPLDAYLTSRSILR